MRAQLGAFGQEPSLVADSFRRMDLVLVMTAKCNRAHGSFVGDQTCYSCFESGHEGRKGAEVRFDSGNDSSALISSRKAQYELDEFPRFQPQCVSDLVWQ